MGRGQRVWGQQGATQLVGQVPVIMTPRGGVVYSPPGERHGRAALRRRARKGEVKVIVPSGQTLYLRYGMEGCTGQVNREAVTGSAGQGSTVTSCGMHAAPAHTLSYPVTLQLSKGGLSRYSPDITLPHCPDHADHLTTWSSLYHRHGQDAAGACRCQPHRRLLHPRDWVGAGAEVRG